MYFFVSSAYASSTIKQEASYLRTDQSDLYVNFFSIIFWLSISEKSGDNAHFVFREILHSVN